MLYDTATDWRAAPHNVLRVVQLMLACPALHRDGLAVPMTHGYRHYNLEALLPPPGAIS